METNSINFNFKTEKGFSLLELLVYVSIMSFLMVAVVSFIMWMDGYSLRGRADSETVENVRATLDKIVYEVRNAKNIYAPTTSTGQLSLETVHYLPDNEISAYIDFFLCGTAVCLKKESQDPIALTPDSIKVTDLSFVQVYSGSFPSIQVDITASYNNYTNNPSGNYSFTLTSTATPRSY